jgi:hypothetical protein
MSTKAAGRETFEKIERFMKMEYSFLRRMDKGKPGSRYGGPQKRYSLGAVPEGKKWTRFNTPRLYITMNSDDIEVEVVLAKELGGTEKVQTRLFEGVGVTLSTGVKLVGQVYECNKELHLLQYNFTLERETLHHSHAVALVSYIVTNGVA